MSSDSSSWLKHEDDTIVKHAKEQPADSSKSAVFIFLHGFDDDGAGLANIADQFQAANKLNHLTWIFPTAPENRDAMARAWYTPSKLTPLPSSRPELDDPEDEDGMMRSVAYVESLVTGLEEKGVPVDRIVLGGFSQGHAIIMLTGLVSRRLSAKLAGLVALHGYLPLAERIKALRKENGLPDTVDRQVPIFQGRGMRDVLVPKRYRSIQMQVLEEAGVHQDTIADHQYEGLGHSLNGEELRDLCTWLEKIIPPLE